MRTIHTHTNAVLELSPEAYREIRKKLLDAGYEHVFDGMGSAETLIDMNGIALGEQRLSEAETARLRLIEAFVPVGEELEAARRMGLAEVVDHVIGHHEFHHEAERASASGHAAAFVHEGILEGLKIAKRIADGGTFSTLEERLDEAVAAQQAVWESSRAAGVVRACDGCGVEKKLGELEVSGAGFPFLLCDGCQVMMSKEGPLT